MDAWFDELAELIRIPSISADEAHAGDVLRAAEWVRDFIRGAGGEAEVVDWEGQPLVIGEIHASHDGEGAPTILCYGHFDVQPPDPLELWESPPFEATIRDGYLYARGSVDDKGQLYMLLAAARELAQAGALGVNVRFCCDGEEETAGHSLVDFIAADERGADAAIIFDSTLIRPGVPAFEVATRGNVYYHLTMRTGERDLHSGLFGGAALNAAHALVRTLDALIAQDGRVPGPLRVGIASPTDEERDGWHELPPGAEELAEQGARPMDESAAEEFYVRTTAETTFEVHGIATGSPHLQMTVIPVEAVANVSLRLAPGQEVEQVCDAFEGLVRDAAPVGAELTIERLAASGPGLVPADAPAIKLAQDAFERVVGRRPLLIRGGGTLPIVPAFTGKGIPVIITGFGLPDCQIHSPNERLRAEYVPLGIAAARETFRELSNLRPS
jgi:acetylornithine deacetylase/succinyl-diaminopimelate desuccinylase-like protein